jgi:mitogen-activated protein kinase kinase 1
MDKFQNSNVKFEKEINELGSEIVKIKINRNKHNKNKQENNDITKEEKKEENIKNNNDEKEEKILNNKEDNNNNNEKKDEFNLDVFNNFLQKNENVIGSSNNNKQLKSHLKPHLKLNLGLSGKKKEMPKIVEIKNNENNDNNEKNNTNKNENNVINNINDQKNMNNNDNNYEKNNDENIFDNININNINEAENLKYSLDQNSKLESKNIESSLILKQKFNKMNESQISYDASNMSINHLNDHSKIKKKKKLSLYDLQKLALLGAGSSGEVYLVQDTETKKKLALKTVKYTEDEKTKNQLETEVKLSTIKHENIIRIYATYFLKGKINFVMEYMDRGTIADLLKKVKKIPEKFVGLITYQVVKGMAYCQKEKRIIHRDLKPSNILVNSKGEIKISDFGVSTIVESSWAQKKTMIGTYIYMAPERIDADIYYINCDVWSLGIIVMECILGYYPYIIYNNNVLPNTVWIVHDLIENNPVPKLDENIYSQELIDFSNQCLTKDIKKRPTAEKLLNHPFLQRYANSSRDDLALWLKSIN